ncbi:MAG: tripartite tricarboxylate transporter TctB family protein [Syntrophaceae bacterium]|nr:tripartite tricarboxylate transporter TctB family protein [Syntrophaceae bacterium]
MTKDRLSGIILLLLAVFVMIETRVLPLGTHSRPGPGYLPLLLSSFLAILGVILIVWGRLASSWRSVKWSEGLHALAILAGSVFTTLTLETLGYRLTMLILMVFLFGVMERLKWWMVFSLSVGLSFGSFWLFDTMLKVILPRGGLGF